MSASDWSELEANGQTQIVYSGDAVVIGPFLQATRAMVDAYHTGHKTGEGDSAWLAVQVAGGEIGRAEDSDFSNYHLAVRKTVQLAPLSQVTVAVAGGNHHATTDSLGMSVTVARA